MKIGTMQLAIVERNRLRRPRPRTSPYVFLMLLGLAAAATYGETIVVGGGPGSVPWDEQYSEISVIDFETNPGFIQPSQNGPEDNISLKLIERGGTITSPNARVVLEISQSRLNDLMKNMVDGRDNAFEVKVPRATGIIIRFDLGERFGVNRITFFPRKSSEEFFLRGYKLSLNDGSVEQRTLAGTPDFKLFKTVERNLDPVIDLAVPLQFVRFIEVKQLVRGEWEIDEFQIFGEGFASAASYTSTVFDQRRPAVFGGITWAKGSIGEPTKAGVTLSTRSGSTPDPGDSLTWSGWSPPYPAAVRTEIVSPAPRRYWQFRLQFQTSDILSAATVDSIAVEVSTALADSLLGEIWPQNVLIGQNTALTYSVRVFNSRGFDRLEIETQAPVEVVRSVQIDGFDVEWEKTDIDDGVQISFPRITGNRLLRVVFESIALQFNTVFTGRVFDSQRPRDLPQVITAGEAASDALALGDDLSVTIVVAKKIIRFLEAAPSPFTPNGDGINEETIVTYDIVNLTGPAPVSVKVYDLAGRLRREVYSGLDSSGRYQRAWDGADDSGQKLSPGVYFVCVEVAADTGTVSKTAIVPLVF
jgi:hypothetical protein